MKTIRQIATECGVSEQAVQALHAGTIQQQLAGESTEQEAHEPEEKKSWLRRIFNR